jgi:hypothetical protein
LFRQRVAEHEDLVARQTTSAGKEDDSAATTIDSLCIQVLAEHEHLTKMREEENAVLAEIERLAVSNRDALQRLAMHNEDARENVNNNEDIKALCRERGTLLSVFRQIILQSGVDWWEDDVLKEVLMGGDVVGKRKKR